MIPSGRTAELVLVTPDGAVVGSLSAVPVATPWWQDVAPVVAAARECHGVDVTILRLLEAERDRPPGGRVTYLEEEMGSEDNSMPLANTVRVTLSSFGFCQTHPKCFFNGRSHEGIKTKVRLCDRL